MWHAVIRLKRRNFVTTVTRAAAKVSERARALARVSRPRSGAANFRVRLLCSASDVQRRICIIDATQLWNFSLRRRRRVNNPGNRRRIVRARCCKERQMRQ